MGVGFWRHLSCARVACEKRIESWCLNVRSEWRHFGSIRLRGVSGVTFGGQSGSALAWGGSLRVCLGRLLSGSLRFCDDEVIVDVEVTVWLTWEWKRGVILVQSLASREDSSVVRYNLRSRGPAVLSGMERDVIKVPEQLETYRSQLAIASQQVEAAEKRAAEYERLLHRAEAALEEERRLCRLSVIEAKEEVRERADRALDELRLERDRVRSELT